MSVDERTRVDGEVDAVDPTTCFEEVLPAAFERRADLLAPAVAEYAPQPLTIEVDGDAWTLALDGGVVRVRAGRDDDAPTVLRTSPAQLDDLVRDQVTVVGMQTNGSLDQPVGGFDALLDWWLLLRGALRRTCAAHAGRSISSTPTARRSRSTAPSRPTLSLEEMGDFLQRAGYLHIARVFDEDEMAAVSRDMDAAAPTYSRDDGRSWWARNRAGDDLLVRMQYFDEVSPAVERLVGDDRLQRLAGLTGDGHVFGTHGGQPHRGAVQAVRRRRGDLRPPVAQGLRARSAQLRLQQHDRRHLGERRRRRVRSTAHRRRLAPRLDVAGVARPGPLRPPASCRSRPAPATSPSTSRAPCTSRSRRSSGSAASCTPGSACRRAAPTPSAPRSSASAPSGEDAPVKAPSANRA